MYLLDLDQLQKTSFTGPNEICICNLKLQIFNCRRDMREHSWKERESVAPKLRKFSPEIIDLLDKLLDLKPETRIKPEEVMRHPWYNKPLSAEHQKAWSDMEAKQKELSQEIESCVFDEVITQLWLLDHSTCLACLTHFNYSTCFWKLSVTSLTWLGYWNITCWFYGLIASMAQTELMFKMSLSFKNVFRASEGIWPYLCTLCISPVYHNAISSTSMGRLSKSNDILRSGVKAKHESNATAALPYISGEKCFFEEPECMDKSYVFLAMFETV